MMESKDVELKLLDQYLDQLNDASSAEEISRGLALYERQVVECSKVVPNFNMAWHQSAIYWFHAWRELRSEGGFFERTSRDAARQSGGLGSTLILAGLARDREHSRVRKAISYLDKAIDLTDDLDSRFLRATCYLVLKERSQALRDAEYIISNCRGDQEVFLKARRLKDEIETFKDSRCFIATAVYGSSQHPSLDVLRWYRDTTLLRSPIGRRLVSLYYIMSPSLAEWLCSHPRAGLLVRTHLLDPMVESISTRMR